MGYRPKTVALEESSRIILSSLVGSNNSASGFEAVATPSKIYLELQVRIEDYNQGNPTYTAAKGLSVYVDNKMVGKTNIRGRLKIDLTNRLNDEVSLDVRSNFNGSKPSLPHRFKFTKDGQKLSINIYHAVE